jgi:hypothetical protein
MGGKNEIKIARNLAGIFSKTNLKPDKIPAFVFKKTE